MATIKLQRGQYGHVSMLEAASDLVTHAHPEMHIIIWLGGDPGRIRVGDATIELGRGIAVGINSFEPHSHCFGDGGVPGSFLAFYLDPAWVVDRRLLAPHIKLFRRPAIALEDWLHTMCLGLFDRLGGDAGVSDLETYEMERLIDSLLDAADTAQPAADMQTKGQNMLDFRVRKAMAMMHARVCDRICLEDLARDVGLSRPHFFALFKEQTNLTPNVYWNTLRMEEALRQLDMSEESLTTVATNLGFTTQGNFTRFFRDHAGVPPTVYREASRLVA